MNASRSFLCLLFAALASAGAIDTLLNEEVPEYFRAIRIE